MPTSRMPAAVLGGPTWISPLVRVTACLTGSCDRLSDVHDAFGEVVNEASSESGRQYESGRGDRTRTSPGCCICACLSRHCPRLSAIALQVERDVS